MKISFRYHERRPEEIITSNERQQVPTHSISIPHVLITTSAGDERNIYITVVLVTEDLIISITPEQGTGQLR